jgi:hypothetical integral membrane protein (TIGR02206 family)
MGILGHFFYYYSGGKAENGVKNYSLLHFGWLSIALVILIVAVYVYNNISALKKNKIIKLSAILLVSLYFVRVFWAVSIGRFRVDSMLPLHLCGMMVFVDFFAVFTDYVFLKEFAYAAGLPGAVIAFLTPELNGYPLISFQYQNYIFSHLLLIIIPLFWVLGNGFKPSKKYKSKIFSLMCAIAIFDGFVNKVLNSNYMFVSKAPLNTPLIYVEKWFGYKGYVGVLVIFAFVTLNLMYLPWKIDTNKDGREKTLIGINN